jgi:hypothetical protein
MYTLVEGVPKSAQFFEDSQKACKRFLKSVEECYSILIIYVCSVHTFVQECTIYFVGCSRVHVFCCPANQNSESRSQDSLTNSAEGRAGGRIRKRGMKIHCQRMPGVGLTSTAVAVATVATRQRRSHPCGATVAAAATGCGPSAGPVGAGARCCGGGDSDRWLQQGLPPTTAPPPQSQASRPSPSAPQWLSRSSGTDTADCRGSRQLWRGRPSADAGSLRRRPAVADRRQQCRRSNRRCRRCRP